MVWLLLLLSLCGLAHAQVDQGAITGVVQDSSGAAIPNARVTLTNPETGLALQRQANESGVYVFSPVKIGDYTLSASAPGFSTTKHENLHVDIQQRLDVDLKLQLGSASETVTVTTGAPLLETQEAAVGQVISTETINNTPLNGRNWVYIAQLTAGVAPPFGGTRGSGTGDFVANGQRAEQNNFVLDGVDIAGWPPYRVSQSGLGLVPENRGIFGLLSVEENLSIARRRGSPWSLNDIYEIFPRLEERRRNGGSQLSGGEQQMLSIARTPR